MLASMLIRSHDDAADDETRWRRFVTDQGFGHFVAAGRNRAVPVVVPTQFVFTDDQILFHLARQNPVFVALEENEACLLSVAGDWAYIPGAWKAVRDEDPRHGIPTTYYAAVQLTGIATIHDDATPIVEVLETQLQDLEPNGGLVSPRQHPNQLRAIRAITVEVTEVRAKFKFGGNVDQEHRDQIADRLATRARPGDRAAMRHMAGLDETPAPRSER